MDSGCDRCGKTYVDKQYSVDVWAQEVHHWPSTGDAKTGIQIDEPGEYLSYCLPCWKEVVLPLFRVFVRSALSTP